MKKIISIIAILIRVSQVCYGYVLGVNDEYYERVVEPKLDVLRDMVMNKAVSMIVGRKPDYEIELTANERYFSSDTMEFLTGESRQEARYSGVKKLVAWRQGLTLITGWTLDGFIYHVNYVYTRDARFEPISGIHAFGRTSELERYFGGSLFDISAEDGSVGHIQAVYGNDDWASACVLVSYTGKNIESLELWDDNVNGDKVPIVPRTEKMDKYIQDSKTNIDFDAEYGLELTLSEIRRQKTEFSLLPETEKHDTDLVLRTVWIVILSLSVGVVLLLLLVVIYRKLGTRPPTRVLVNVNVPRQEKTNSPSKEEDYIDVEYVEVSKLKDTE